MFFLRLISWIVLVGLFFTAVFLKETGRYILFVMFVFGAFMAVYEVLNMLEKIELKSFKKISAFAAAMLVAAVFINDEKFILIPFTLFLIGCWGYLLICNEKEKNMKKQIVSLGGSLLALVPIFFLAKIYNNIGELNIWLGPKLLFYFVVVTKIGDTFAYITGVLSNKIMKGKNHKIVPSISPKKSWEGTIGGMIFSIISSYFLYKYLFDDNSLFFSLIAGAFLFWGGFFGDLAESALKRTCGIKDAGKIIPGMGGVCDLIDSFIFNAPLFYFYILLF